MSFRKTIGVLAKYTPLFVLMAIHIISLFRCATTIIEDVNRSISIWTDVLRMTAIIGGIGNFLVLDKFNKLIIGKTPNIIEDIVEESNQHVAVLFNGFIAKSLFITVIFVLTIIYIFTKNRLFVTISVIISTILAVSNVIYFIAMYLQIKNAQTPSIFSKLVNPAILPMIICMLQILITRKNWVSYIYYNISEPKNNLLLSLSLIIVLCYVLAVSFSHFSNIYCLIGLIYIKRDLGKMQKQLYFLQEKVKIQEDHLRQATKNIDEKAEQVGLIKRFMLIFCYYFIHIKTYFQGQYNAVLYLLSLFKYKIAKRFNGLLNPERVKINSIRFCLIISVLELLSLDFVLFIYFERHEPCLKFFELLSTVIIIPIMLSWLADLKSKGNEKSSA